MGTGVGRPTVSFLPPASSFSPFHFAHILRAAFFGAPRPLIRTIHDPIPATKEFDAGAKDTSYPLNAKSRWPLCAGLRSLRAAGSPPLRFCSHFRSGTCTEAHRPSRTFLLLFLRGLPRVVAWTCARRSRHVEFCHFYLLCNVGHVE